MEVNRSNFQDLLPFIETCIDECDFVAIDTEFTGINSNETPTIFDTLQDYYKKLKNGSSEFLILQLGLVTFKYDVNTDKFLQSAFNFYVFPIPLPGLNRNVNFLCQSQSMSFLASTAFDFNKVFHEGISYLTKAEEETYKKQLDEKRKKRADNQNNEFNLLNLKEQDQKEVDSISKRIEEFLKYAEPNEELVLGKYNSYLRRVIYNNVAERFKGKVGFDIKSNLDDANSMYTVVAYLRGSKQHQQERENEKQLEEEKNLQQAVGVSYIIRRISESGKLVVGHNMFLDIMHITNHFLQKIPNDYYSFKDIVSVCFPNILDTKHMASCSPFHEKIRYSTLNHLVSTFENPEIDVVPGGKGYTVSADKGHEAAFDAFTTGLSFLSMLKFIDCVFPLDYSVLDPYINKIFVFKLTDIPYMNIGGADLKPKRDHVLYASFSSSWKTKDIESFFHGYGRISVVWINDSSAYVCLPNEAAAKKALKGLSKSKQCKLLSFFKYEALMNAAKPLPTKESLKEKKEFPSYPEIPASKIAKLLGCASSPEHDSDEEIEIENEKKPLQILTCSKASTAVKRSMEENEGNSIDEDEVVPSKKRVFQEDNTWE